MADIKFSAATDADPPAGTDIIGMERPGSPATAVRTTIAEILALATGSALPAPPSVDGDYVLGVADTGATLSWDTLAGGGASALDDLSDVDLTTDAPASGDRLEYDGTDWVPVARGVGQPYDIAIYRAGVPEDSEVIFAMELPRAIAMNDDFAGAVGYIRANPTATLVLTVKLAGSSIGTVTVSTGGAFTFATTGGAVAGSIGDLFELVNQATADATAAGISVSFLAVTT